MLEKIKRSRIWPITRKEFLHLTRDIRTLLITFALPVVMIILYGYALTFDIRQIPMAVRDHDKKPLTREIVKKFESSGYFKLVGMPENPKEEEEYFLSGKASVLVNFDEGFSGKVISGKGASMQVIVDGADANTAIISMNYINGIMQEYSKGIILNIFSKKGIRPFDGLLPIDSRPRVLYNPELKSINFLVPGIISFVLMILAALITSLSIVSEKTRGTMEQLLATSIKPIEIMIGKLLPYVLIGFCDVLLCVGTGYFVFKVPIRGSLILLFIESTIFIFGSLGLGILISTIAKRQEDAIILGVMTTMLPSILLSGFIFPIESMPKVIQVITYIVPARYFLTIMRGIFLKGIGIEHLWLDTLFLIIFSFLMIGLAAKQFRKRLD